MKIVRTHGGLGNQLFQVLFAECHGSHETPQLYHDDRYPHKFQLSSALKRSYCCYKPSGLIRILLDWRIVKLFEKIGISRSHLAVLGCVIYDGYFQQPYLYEEFKAEKIAHIIEKLRSIFLDDRANESRAQLVHLRLGDFYRGADERIEVAEKILNKLDSEVDLITTDDALINNSRRLQAIIRDKCARHVNTSHMTAEQVLQLIAQYEGVNSNNSTLAFWGALLGGADLKMTDPKLVAVYERIRDAERRISNNNSI